MKCIAIFIIYKFLILKILNDVIVINFILGSPFHINFKNLLHGFFDQSHVQGYSQVDLLIFRIKSIGDNYRIYGLIIVNIAKKLLVLDYGLSNAAFETPNHAFALQVNKFLSSLSPFLQPLSWILLWIIVLSQKKFHANSIVEHLL